MMVVLKVLVRLMPVLALFLGASAVLAAQPVEKENSAGRTKVVFAVSWLPGFCDTQPERPECKGQTPDRFDATHFTLHGLWPVGKTYCGVDAAVRAQDGKKKWLELPKLELAEKTAVTLARVMPGVQPGFDRHQWVRSGQCYTSTAEAYFDVQLRYLEVLNSSAVGVLFNEKLGERITEQEVRQAVDVAFGPGAGARVRMQCAKAGETTVVTGLTFGLGDGEKPVAVDAAGGTAVTNATDTRAELSRLILAADATHGKCTSGIVYRAGRP
ncbi:ribonuclease T2 [Pararhizobium capsulatum DSM 1112]|uniref:Ribonuclease T2 n=1 Tax=Pararhizobium capsulatum DSM 1112 TaxID=1121113 RepID=A0ABU0BRT5_9HYPH|nr:ribonuclease [Pararhizobium capsulatum]MDQ0320970.1 ribonuclease T2 [Pararhizobium capsulatum DSM 1112]